MCQWQVYYPNDGETIEDAHNLGANLLDAEHAAEIACVHDYNSRGGWERGLDIPFPAVIISPDGSESRWTLKHERSIYHRATEAVCEPGEPDPTL